MTTLADAAAAADALAQAGDERSLAALRVQWDEEIEAAARDADYRVRAQAYRAIAQFRFRQKLQLLRRGLEDESPAARGSALIALEGLSRGHPGDVNSYRRSAPRARRARPEPGRPSPGRHLLEERGAHRDTIQLLEGIAESDDVDADMRKTARVVQTALKRKALAK